MGGGGRDEKLRFLDGLLVWCFVWESDDTYSWKTPMAQTATMKRYHPRQAAPRTSVIIGVSWLKVPRSLRSRDGTL